MIKVRARMKLIVFIIYGGILLGCTNGEKGVSRLEQALLLSGDNRVELEKVLEYFSRNVSDSLRLKSAEFLIENMPGHWGVDSNSVKEYKQCLDSISGLPFAERKWLSHLPSEDLELCPTFTKVQDIRTIKADFLIRHIEKVCRQKDSCPWLAHTNFEVFSEYLLPYRIGHEWLEEGRDVVDKEAKDDVDYALRYYNDCSTSPNSIYLYRSRMENMKPLFKVSNPKLRGSFGLPEHRQKIVSIRLRRLGIPVVSDYCAMRHVAQENPIGYSSIDERIFTKPMYRNENLRSGKIYRQTYSRHPVPIVADSQEYVPPFFRNPFQKDVTDIYLRTVDLSLAFPLTEPYQYGYLAMFDGKEWQPVAYAEIRNKQCLFTKLGKGFLYMPVYYPHGEMQPIAAPFILRLNGTVQPLTGFHDSLTTIQCQRFQVYTDQRHEFNSYWKNTRFECADDFDFKCVDTVFTVERLPYYKLEKVHLSPVLKKRYWRLFPAGGICWVSELYFIDEKGEVLTGKYIQKDTSGMFTLTDHNPVTGKVYHKAITLDFGKPVSVAEIRYMGRNDRYNIKQGQKYELYGFQGGQWVSIASNLANENGVEFKKIPTNLCYQLRDESNGEKGGLFTWEEGKVRFW